MEVISQKERKLISYLTETSIEMRLVTFDWLNDFTVMLQRK